MAESQEHMDTAPQPPDVDTPPSTQPPPKQVASDQHVPSVKQEDQIPPESPAIEFESPELSEREFFRVAREVSIDEEGSATLPALGLSMSLLTLFRFIASLPQIKSIVGENALNNGRARLFQASFGMWNTCAILRYLPSWECKPGQFPWQFSIWEESLGTMCSVPLYKFTHCLGQVSVQPIIKLIGAHVKYSPAEPLQFQEELSDEDAVDGCKLSSTCTSSTYPSIKQMLFGLGWSKVKCIQHIEESIQPKSPQCYTDCFISGVRSYCCPPGETSSHPIDDRYYPAGVKSYRAPIAQPSARLQKHPLCQYLNTPNPSLSTAAINPTARSAVEDLLAEEARIDNLVATKFPKLNVLRDSSEHDDFLG